MNALHRILRVLAGLTALVLLSHEVAAEPAVTGLRIGQHPSKTRIVLDVSSRVAFETFVLSDPYRVVVDLPEVKWRLKGSKIGRSGTVSAYRYGLFAKGKARLVLDVKTPVKVKKAFLLPPNGNSRYRIVVDLVSVSRAEVLAARKPSRPRPSTPTPVARPKAPKSKTIIVVDAGHGGVDPGTKGANGVWEKHIVLSHALELSRQLRATRRYHVIMTRKRDVFLPLRRRVEIARSKGADLFISLHADSISNPSFRGAHIYTLSESGSDKEAEELAAKENKSDIIAGVDFSAQSEDVTSILIDLAQRETMNQSAVFARLMAGELRKSTTVVRRAHRFAGFVVLKAPDVPSVLLELGYLSNPAEARMLGRKGPRRKIAKAVVRSIDRYFARQQALNKP